MILLVSIERIGLKKPQTNDVSLTNLFENADHCVYVASSCGGLQHGDRDYLYILYLQVKKENPKILSLYEDVRSEFVPALINKTERNLKRRKDKDSFEKMASDMSHLVSISYTYEKRAIKSACFTFDVQSEPSFTYTVTNMSQLLGHIVTYLFRN